MKQAGYNLVLASGSPRRHEILDLAQIPHTVRVSHADESAVVYCVGKPEEYVMELAELKGSAVPPMEGEVVLSADTVVYVPEYREVLGKPKDHDDAVRMFHMMSGGMHKVITGVSLRDWTGQKMTFAAVTEVVFRALSEEEIEAYIESSEPYDKAGAYGIQEQACVFVKELRGEYFNVVGLPVTAVYEALQKMEESRL
ncbi:MAG: septum formation protein Maf [Clostridia bacterium]|nr:septum formation protein Maf [Clostridia bacterium]